MVSAENLYIQPEENFFNGQEIELQQRTEKVEIREDVILVKRKVEQPSILEIRFARLKKALRTRSSGII